MRAYLVGGAVRDGLLGLAVKDRDFVVVGATPQQMISAGFKPVGADFPVFLHPQSGAHYALARTERKRGRGHKGFVFYAAPDVTLDDDLRRRDFTINAMARTAGGDLIDPCLGRRDLEAGILRHIAPAFCEDPLRIFRAARLCARLGFEIAEETRDLLRRMSESGEADSLPAERIWKEIAGGLAASPIKRESGGGQKKEEKIPADSAGIKALCRAAPSRMFAALRECGMLARVLPEVEALFASDDGECALVAADQAAADQAAAETRFAALLLRIPADALRGLCRRLRVPHGYAAVADAAADLRRRIDDAQDADSLFSPDALSRLRIFHGTDDAAKITAAIAADLRAANRRRTVNSPSANNFDKTASPL